MKEIILLIVFSDTTVCVLCLSSVLALIIMQYNSPLRESCAVTAFFVIFVVHALLMMKNDEE